MQPIDDRSLLGEYAENRSDQAFAMLVATHIDLVYSVAFRCVNDPHQAEEISQAVFIILARKAPQLRHEKALSSWLFQTTRLTANNYIRSESRRHHREQEAYMQSTLNEPDDRWPQIAPLLDDAVARLGEKDRRAIVLRFFEGRNLRDVGLSLNASEQAAEKRVNRAVEKLRTFFNKRGIILSVAALAGTVAANSVQAAPAGLAASVAATTLKGTAISASLTAIVKGTMKTLTWLKIKFAIGVSAGILLAVGTTTVVIGDAITSGHSILEQRLEDGSTLTLNSVSFGDNHAFVHGGINKIWKSPGHEELALEFRLTSKDGANHPLVKPAFYRQFRCMLRGEAGIEYALEFMPDTFKEDSGSYYGYVETGVLPRDSRWLRAQIEKREDSKQYLWEKVAEFKFENPAKSAHLRWTAQSAPTTNTVNGMDIVLGEVTVKSDPNLTNDIWNHVVKATLDIYDHGVLQTNWAATYISATDASGNWANYSRWPAWLSLDPRYIWKLDMEFEPVSDFSDEDMLTVSLPKQSSSITTNLFNVPVTISVDTFGVNGAIPTNHPSLALKFIGVSNDQGDTIQAGSASWSQYHFREGGFMTLNNGYMTMNSKPTKVTFAIIPDVHATFYAQPRLVVEKQNN